MFTGTGWSAVVVIAFVVVTPGWAQTPEPPTAAPPPPPPPPPPTNKPDGDDEGTLTDGFVVPHSVNDDVDVFAFESLEYLVVNRKRRRSTAELLCSMEYNGQLAIMAEPKLALFMAEALSETNLVLDALWIGGRNQGNDTNPNWIWESGKDSMPIDPELVKKFSQVTEVTASDRNCLAFARLDHDKPDYRAMACNAQRAVLCQRQRGGGGGGNSTHPGWIKLGKRLYKIFSEQVPWEIATERCFQKDPDAQLAVLIGFNFSQLLGRYLLVGRPSLENAWIGAKWQENQYQFIPETIVLSNDSDGQTNPWPPWRNFKISKTGGCLLLDRHLSNITLFVEARCDRNRPFICYKFSTSDTGNDSFADVIIGDNGYRLHYARKTWNDSYDYCATKYEKYNAWLSDILSVDVKYELLYVMGENRTAVQHIWIAGMFVGGTADGPVWTWMKDKSKINTDILDWVTNDTFNLDAEQLNTCLDMDRENHIRGLHYGANCAALQQFVCSFKKEDLLRLERDEAQEAIDKRTPAP